MLRGIVSLIIGAAVTFALFVFMAFLVGGGPTRHETSTETPVIEITMNRDDATAQNKPRVKPKPPTPPEQPPKPDTTPPDSSSDIDTNMSFNMGGVEAGGANTGFKLGNMMTRDGDATPIVRIEPQYPIAAARDGKEGWVQLSFTINELGGVEDVKVIKAEPKRLFNKEARRALKKWKYKPKIVDGKALKQPGMTVQLDFTLDKGGR
ncbi:MULTISPECIES: energy transducer TonB [Shewanella]|uniref:Protein TonB n=1 Tax=Shewanella fidelis TaxID=173509 RepID=A0AAW8NLL1_9GAMM|nr:MULTISPECIES: energy transducer TonB [Shewanella]MDR8523265.1 energy transducer TonB [Shewanella fidelis]MDW4811409.1 energy transducer TonB [Shewanella fidelis]MDW4815530.1 energy transducer TonB [Shewanella fidelis]MDW4819620.1 energy transducer TonB [Shewanella fidelis]MDW4824406.1 energy transducer TonB [Shewanella fidelis]